jgi:methionyl-tRNA formyltransferase
MNYVFFGTPRFAEIVLGELLGAKLPPTAVVCNPDRPFGRKKAITPPPVKVLAAKIGIPVLQPEQLDEAFGVQLKRLTPDFFAVAAYAKIIPQHILDVPRLGTLGVHPSLLPKYRGASPIQSALLAGERTTGVSIYLMDAKMDHGPVFAEEKMAIPEGENYSKLEERLAHLGGKLFAKTVPDFFAGTSHPQVQDETEATFTKKFKTEDGFVDEKELAAAVRGETVAAAIYRKILALNPEPGVWTVQDGKRLKLLDAKLEHGSLRLTLTQREGEKPKRS